MINYGQPCSTLFNHGQTIIYYGHSWLTKVDHCQLWENIGNDVQLWSTMVSNFSNMANHGHPSSTIFNDDQNIVNYGVPWSNKINIAKYY
jgi:hypothetical protein